MNQQCTRSDENGVLAMRFYLAKLWSFLAFHSQIVSPKDTRRPHGAMWDCQDEQRHRERSARQAPVAT
jgi:hypothetical protein